MTCVMCLYITSFCIFFSQVVYAIAYEGARLEIPEGPLGKLIAGLVTAQSVVPECLSDVYGISFSDVFSPVRRLLDRTGTKTELQ